jgi:hypothetical protein
MICFQLAVGCNSSQLSVTGGETFSFTGLIVKTFNNVNNLVFPSAMAEAKIGDISIYDISNLGAPILIATQAIYGSSKSFNITVDRDQVKDRPIQFSYVAIGTTPDLRDHLENTNDYESTMDVTLDANSTYRASLVDAELTNLIASDASNNHPVKIGDTIRTFDESKYNIVKKYFSPIDFVATFTTTEVRSEIAQLILLNETPADIQALEADIKVLKTDAKNAAQAYGRLGAKLVCGTSLAVIVDSAKYETAELFFDTTDDVTGKTLKMKRNSRDLGKFFSTLEGNNILAKNDEEFQANAETNKISLSRDLGKFFSTLEGNNILAKNDEEFQANAKTNKISLSGSWRLVDWTNKITTKCNVRYESTTPAASSAYFDKFDEADYAKFGEAASKLDSMYDDTIQKLIKDFATAKIDTTKCQASDSSSAAKEAEEAKDKAVSRDSEVDTATMTNRTMSNTGTTTDTRYAANCPIYLKEVAIVERWYNDYIETSLAYFAKK